MRQHAEGGPHEGTHVRLYRQGDPEIRTRIPHYLSVAVPRPGKEMDPDLHLPEGTRMSIRTGWSDWDRYALGQRLGVGPVPVYLTQDQVADLARVCMNILADLPGDPSMSVDVRVAGKGVRCDDDESTLRFLGVDPESGKGVRCDDESTLRFLGVDPESGEGKEGASR